MHRALTYAALLTTVFCWGLAPVAMRYLVADITPLQLVSVRLLITLLVFLPVLIRSRLANWSRNDIVLAIAIAIVGMDGYYIPVTFGAQWLASGTIGLLSATGPVWMVLLSMLINRETVRRWVFLGLLMSVGGIYLLLGPSAESNFGDRSFLIGAALVLLSSLMWSLYSVVMKPLTLKYGALSCTSLTTVVSVVPPILFLDSNLFHALAKVDAVGWVAMFVLTLGGSIIATIFWNYGVSQVGASQAGLFLYLVPLISIVGGHLFLNELVGANVIISGTVILLGVALAQVGGSLPNKTAAIAPSVAYRSDFEERQ